MKYILTFLLLSNFITHIYAQGNGNEVEDEIHDIKN